MRSRRFKGSSWVLAGLIFVLAISLSSVFAQDLGSMRGKVKDIEGNPLANVKISLIHPQQGIIVEFKSDKKGNFYRHNLDVGEYDITFELEGYYPVKERIMIAPSQTPKINVTLKKIEPVIRGGKDFEKGNQLFQEGKYEEASKAFNKVLEKDPDYPEALINLGLCYLKLNEIDKALPYLEKAVQVKPDFAAAYISLGQAYFIKGEMEKSIEYFSKGAELQSDNPKVYYNIAIVYYQMQKYSEAVEALKKSIDLDPVNASAYYQLAICYGRLGNAEKMVENFEAFLKLEPNAPEAPQVKDLIKKVKEKLSQQKPQN